MYRLTLWGGGVNPVRCRVAQSSRGLTSSLFSPCSSCLIGSDLGAFGVQVSLGAFSAYLAIKEGSWGCGGTGQRAPALLAARLKPHADGLVWKNIQDDTQIARKHKVGV